MLALWVVAGAGVVLWSFEGRSFGELRLAIPEGWRIWVIIGLIAAVAIIYGRSIRRIARSKRIKVGDPRVFQLSPQTNAELASFMALSLSAGVCEEFVFRGFLISAFQPLIGLWGAAAVSVVVFALAHAYEGTRGIISTGLVGLFFTLVVLVLGSLLAAMVIHVLIDVAEGLVAWLAVRKMQIQVGHIAEAEGSA
jgi:membrane protease YdiL (CAAX protease family)